jgi:Rrf2 family protein
MRLSNGVEWAVHCTVLLAQVSAGTCLPRTALSTHYDIPDAYLAKHLRALVNAGVLQASTGPNGGFSLSRPPEEISVLDVVEAVEGPTSPFQCTEIRQRGLAATPKEFCRRPCAVRTVIDTAFQAWRESLRSTTIADLVDRLPDTVRHQTRTRYIAG